MEEKTFVHPSYGVVTVSRITSSGSFPLYGSSIMHHDSIRIQIHSSYVKRMLSSDWPMKDKLIMELELSQNQWAELVSSVGIGAGVPCTLRWNKGPVEDCPFTAKGEEFNQEFQQAIDKAMTQIDQSIVQAEELLQKKSLTKKDREDLRALLQSTKQNLTKNIPFIQKQFNKQIDKTVTEAKADLEAHQLAYMQELAKIGLLAQQEGKLPESEGQDGE